MAEFFMSLPLGITCIFLGTFFFTTIIYFLFFTVLAAVLKFFAVGAPFAPTFFMVSEIESVSILVEINIT